MDPWSINTASQISWPPFLFCIHLFLTFWLFFFFFLLSSCIVRCIIWTINKSIKHHNNSEHHSFFNIFSRFFDHFSRFFKAFSMIRSWPRSLNTASQDNELPIFSRLSIHFSWFSENMKKVFSKFIYLYTFVCLYWKPMLLPSCHPNLSFCTHPIPAGCLMGKLMG